MERNKMGKMTYEQWRARYELHEGSNYSEELRRQFISDYLLYPNLAEQCRKHEIPYQTALAWQKKAWWHSISEEILQNHKDELLAKQRRIIEKTYNELEERLENGDEHFNSEHGHVRTKVKSNHLAVIADTTLKANQLLQGKATNISLVTIDNLADKLRTITEQARDITPSPELLDFINEDPSQETDNKD